MLLDDLAQEAVEIDVDLLVLRLISVVDFMDNLVDRGKSLLSLEARLDLLSKISWILDLSLIVQETLDLIDR